MSLDNISIIREMLMGQLYTIKTIPQINFLILLIMINKKITLMYTSINTTLKIVTNWFLNSVIEIRICILRLNCQKSVEDFYKNQQQLQIFSLATRLKKRHVSNIYKAWMYLKKQSVLNITSTIHLSLINHLELVSLFQFNRPYKNLKT